MRPWLSVSSLVVLASGVPAQATWQMLSPAQSPPASSGHVIAYDDARDRGVLVAGTSTWTYDGATWHRELPAAQPPRVDTMVWEPAAAAVLAFGNDAANGPQTWRWDGTTWSQLSVATSPALLGTVRMVYDPVRAVVLLVVGSTSVLETWEWAQGGWTQRVPAASPPPRRGFVLAFDQALRQAVLFGGADLAQPSFLDDTWLWDGTGWRAARPQTVPPGRIDSALVYDELRRRCVLAGGDQLGPLPSNDVWEWDGSDWTQRPAAPFQVRYGHAMAFDRRRQRTVLFGGDGGAPLVLADTWEYRTALPAAAEHYGTGCTGTAGVPDLATVAGARPWLGDALALQLTGLPFGAQPLVHVGASRSMWGAFALPLDLTPAGMTGCTLLASGEVGVMPLAAAGVAVFELAIPASGVAAGQQVYLQGFALDAGANPLGATASSGLALTIAAR